MKTFLLLLLFCLSQSLILHAQTNAFEKQTVLLADGSEEVLWISLDEQTELLHYKHDQREKAAVYKAADVVSFSFGGHYYYSLPLRDDYFTFFKVFHEGGQFAVLEKTPGYKALRVIADDSGGRFSLCQNRRHDEFYLCQSEYSQLHNPISYNPLKPQGRGTPYKGNIREFQVRKLVYLAVEGKLKLFYMETDERFNFWDDWMGPRPGKRRTEQMLEDFIEDPDKLAAVQKKVKQEKLDIRVPEQLIKALGAVYQ